MAAYYATIRELKFSKIPVITIANRYDATDSQVRNFRYYKFRQTLSSGENTKENLRLNRHARMR